MYVSKLCPLILALMWGVGNAQLLNILRKPLERTEEAINDLANASIDAVKTALDVVETGLDVAVETKNFVEDRIKELIENFRKQMGAGIENLGIPKLDPLEINHFDFQVNHQIGKFNGSVDKVLVEDLSLFKINKIQYRVPNIIHVILTFPTVRVKGFYNVNGVIGNLYHIYGKGPFNFTMYDLNANANASLSFKKELKGIFYLKDLQLDISLERFKSNFQNLMGGGNNTELFNRVISELAPEALKMIWPELKPIVTERVQKVLEFGIIPKRIIRYTDKLSSLFSFRRLANILG